ncbi:hypothetical protein MMC30_008671 [Trapelia coarctata]|nr:hypothetical protein [Trapelia coarctata]
MFTDFDELKPLYKTADLVNQISDWPDLYDEERLANNTVPTYAAVYFDDLYVDFDFSMDTAQKIKGCKTFVTNAMYHDAVGSKADEVVRELFKLRDDVID